MNIGDFGKGMKQDTRYLIDTVYHQDRIKLQRIISKRTDLNFENWKKAENRCVSVFVS